MTTPAPVNAVVDHDAGTVTVAVTFRWDRGRLALDKCEAGAFLGQMRQALANFLAAPDGWGAPNGPVTGFSYQCFEPDEERTLGYLTDYSRPVCTLCGQPAVPLNNAPWYQHVDDTDCRNFVDDIGDWHGNLVNFANLLDVELNEGSNA